MDPIVKITPAPENLNILLIGNNPIEMGRVLDKLNRIPGKKIITEIAFDLQSIVSRLVRFNPNFIFIDDNIGRSELMVTVNTLSSNKKTKDVPITVLKNSNYQESWSSQNVLDYLLKPTLSSEAIYTVIKNALKLKRTQLFLSQTYAKRKGQLLNLLKP